MTVAMFFFGMYALLFGRFVLTRRRVVYGANARVVGLLLALALPVGILIPVLWETEIDVAGLHFAIGGFFLAVALWVAFATSKPLPRKRQLLAQAEQALEHFGDQPTGSGSRNCSSNEAQRPTQISGSPPLSTNDRIQH